MKKISKEKGITLVALVITIIILLILAGITISLTLGERGIFIRAQQAKENYMYAANKEQDELRNLEESMNNAENEDNVVDIRKIKIGDYVNYTPQNTITSYKFEAKYTGINTDQQINQDTLRWRVLNVDQNRIELISTSTTYTPVQMTGALGYNNGVYLLNDFCNTLYGNTNKNATARSINIEDIQNKMNLDVWDYHDYIVEASGIKYGNTYNYWTNIYYPYQWRQEKSQKSKIDGEGITGILEMSQQEALTQETYLKAENSIEVQETFWHNYLNENNFIDSIYYKFFVHDETAYPNYWIASRQSCIINTDIASFGLAVSFQEGFIGGMSLFCSDYSSTSDSNYYIRPIVSMPSSMINTDITYNETTGWELK